MEILNKKTAELEELKNRINKLQTQNQQKYLEYEDKSFNITQETTKVKTEIKNAKKKMDRLSNFLNPGKFKEQIIFQLIYFKTANVTEL